MKNLPKILVVDDRKENLLVMEQLLKNMNAEIHTASSGNQALQMVLEHEYALILLDVQMPDMDGFEVAEMMRLSEDTAHIPIIFITAISKEQRHVFKGYRSGAVDYLFKPVESEILLSKVAVFLTIYRQKQELQLIVAELTESKKLIEKQNEVLSRLTIHDDLTGLYNRRHMNTMLSQEFYRCVRYGDDMSLMLLDLDHFKLVNDVHGHQFGDYVLKEFSNRTQKTSRSVDHIFRFGGEEFLILLPRTSISGAVEAGEKIRKTCEASPFADDSISIVVTVSIGVASFADNKLEKPNDLIAMADKALYMAKESGRNKVIFFVRE